MNPIEWLAWLYGRFFAGLHPAIGYAISCGLAALFAALIWTKAIDTYREHEASKKAALGSNQVQAPPDKPQPSLTPPAVTTPAQRSVPAPSSKAMESPKENPGRGTHIVSKDPKPPSVRQESRGPNSPNIATFGANSPVTINAAPGWDMTEQALRALAVHMRPFAPARERGDLITCVLGDPASTSFAATLVNAFRAAGWTLPGSGFNQAVFSGPIFAVLIQIDSEASRPPGFVELYNALQASRLEVLAEVKPEIPEGEFRILVGSPPRR